MRILSMANPLVKVISNPVVQAHILRLGVVLAGVWLDFWKDGNSPQKAKDKIKKKELIANEAAPDTSFLNKKARQETSQGEGIGKKHKIWYADRIQVIEKLWGEGNVFPGDAGYIVNLIAPLGINADMSVLDLSAGLGGLARKIAHETDAYVTGLEINNAFASRGMIMSIAAGKSKRAGISVYDPDTFEAHRKYDCVIARELFSHVIGKKRFFAAVAASVKTGGQIVFTDYVLEEKNKESPIIVDWLGEEKSAAPLSQIEMMNEWKKLGFDVRVAEDQTEEYNQQVLRGLARFEAFISENTPSSETKPSIVREINIWTRRIAAFQAGLKYFRFYGIKH